MKSMKLTKRAAVDLSAAPSVADTPEYPYGLKIYLENEQIMKLGLTEAAVDDEVTITAKAKVCGVHKSETQNVGYDDYRHSVDLQITHMDIGKGK